LCVGRASIAFAGFVFRYFAVVAGRNGSTNRHGAEPGVAAGAARTTGSVASIGRAASSRIGATGNTMAASCLSSLATDIAATDCRAAGYVAPDRRATRGNAAKRIAAGRIAAERRAAGSIATGVRSAIRSGN
jgi:hypothetical protein